MKTVTTYVLKCQGEEGVIEKKFSSVDIPDLTWLTNVLKLGAVDYCYECGSIRSI